MREYWAVINFRESKKGLSQDTFISWEPAKKVPEAPTINFYFVRGIIKFESRVSVT